MEPLKLVCIESNQTIGCFLVDSITLLDQFFFEDEAFWVCGKHVLYSSHHQARSTLVGELVLCFDVLCAEHVLLEVFSQSVLENIGLMLINIVFGSGM